METIAITGSRGLLGSTLHHSLAAAARSATALVSDVRDAEPLQREVDTLAEVSCIVHTAAMTDVAACERAPADAYATNVLGTENVVYAARRTGARLIYTSTASVFSGRWGDYREYDKPEPNNVYNRTKYLSEEVVSAYEKGIVVRLNVIGIHPAGSRGRNFFEWLVNSFRSNEDIRLFDDVYINPLSNWTIADYVQWIINSDVNRDVLHIASSDVCSKAEIGMLVAKHFPESRTVISRGASTLSRTTSCAQNEFG